MKPQCTGMSGGGYFETPREFQNVGLSLEALVADRYTCQEAWL